MDIFSLDKPSVDRIVSDVSMADFRARLKLASPNWNTPLEPVRNLKLADAIAEHLEQLILEGALRPGEKLAAERELAERLEVSRPSLREALERLQARGLLETSKSGTFVTKFMA